MASPRVATNLAGFFRAASLANLEEHRRDDPGLLDNFSGSLFALDAGTGDSSAFCSVTALRCTDYFFVFVRAIAQTDTFLLRRDSIVLLPDGASVTYSAEAIESRLLTV